MIEDSSGGVEASALRMLEQWNYAPATLNGTPVDQSMVHYRVTFVLESGSRGASKSFRRSYGEIQQLIDDGNLENVEELLTDLRFSEKNNLYEDASFWWLNYRYLEAIGSNHMAEKMRSLRLVIGTSETYLPGDVLVFASLQLYQLQLADADYSAAMATFEKLQDSKDARKSDRFESTLAAMKPSYEEILARSSGDQVLALSAEIGVNGYWFHDLLRRSFSISDVTGTGELIEIRCQRRFAEYSFSDASTWTIPDSWGNCGIYVRGDVGTTFTLFEWPVEG